MLLSFPAYAPGARRVMEKPFCVDPDDIEVTIYSVPDTKVAENMPLAVTPDPLNVKSNVELANRFWAPVSTKKSTGNAANILDEVRI